MERRSSERQAFVLSSDPQVQLSFRDALTGARGYLVIDALVGGGAYGGVRICKKMKWTQLAPLARIGTVRYQLARVNMAGAKCGLEYDPEAPDRLQVLERFLRAIAPYLETQLSIGTDVGVTTAEVEQVLARIGLPSRMGAVQKLQGWDASAWPKYEAAMALPAGKEHVRELQVPLYAAHATKAAADMLLPDLEKPRIAVMGLGPYGLRLARGMAAQGLTVVALANSEAGYHAPSGFSEEILTHVDEKLFLDSAIQDYELVTYHEALRVPYDILVLADGRQRLTIHDVGKVGGRLVVEAAQRAVTPRAEYVLSDRGIPVVPNFAVSLGAIIVSDGIFSGAVPPERESIESLLSARARATTLEICRLAQGTRIPLRDAGLRVAFRRWERLPATWRPEHRRHTLDPAG
jgi:glutamate dehydrogenase (NAD(P)+)